ncbi:YfcC family protein [Streptococcus anginosus]|uniref:Arginine-ornithine antiporter n=1 Tax=Streptococcus anginosus TaxID=1328 RepID=A0A3S4P4S0_STRAP|nr:YfcC family protein [Streptococcus anginosus]GAD40255.1 predicted membrane protein [Streptococcus intermedius SK54 = ATCC 27335]EGL46123.1 C4-dicarboxylate anaerobic carrier [Streptococcus anginosus SK52 = DSM 20563]MBX9075355.1 YfcC family protein [Streptococcus anginosus]MBZ2156744.1 YfcC family protein [Streptococcus anginosus]ORE83281.1 arginine:ornithine antiporter [Streptococcus anginosus SK52 = DSM 20563]
MSEKAKKGFKMPSSYTVLMIIIAIMAVLTWIIPAGQYDADKSGNLITGTYKTVAQNPQGIWDVLMAPIRAMLGKEPTSAAIDVSFFILMVGGFLGVVNETGALDVGIASIVKKYKGREKMLILVLMPLFALGGSTYGMGEETMAFYPLLVPVMMAVGFDSLTAVAIILLGSQIGCLASTLNPFATGIASATAGVGTGDGIVLRLIFFVVMTALGTYFVYRYADKIQKDPTKSLVYSHREEDLKHFNVDAVANVESTLSKKQKQVLVLFVLTFVLMIMSFIPWTDLNVHVFENFNKWLVGIPVIGKIVGTSTSALGTWYFPEGAMLFAVMGIIIGFVYRMKEDRFITVFINGAADLLGVALIVAVARGIQVIMNDGMITATILHWGEVGLKGLSSQVFIVLTYIFYLPMSFLIPSTSGLASATMGIMAPLGKFVNVPASLIITAYQSASGLLNLVTPTSGIVMGALALGRIDLGTWWKFVAKLVAGIFVVSILLLILGTFL